MVVIIDPHLKRVSTYPVYQEAKDLEILVKNSNSGEYEGWCWSGSSAWVDFFNPNSWDWWMGLFKTMPLPDGKFSWVDSTENVGVWNDMNEVRVLLIMYAIVLISVGSLQSSTDRRSLCRKTAFTTEAGNTEMCIT